MIKALEPMITGPIHDCCCNADTVESINAQILPILDELVETSFFRYYKVRVALSWCRLVLSVQWRSNLLGIYSYRTSSDPVLFEFAVEFVARLSFVP